MLILSSFIRVFLFCCFLSSSFSWAQDQAAQESGPNVPVGMQVVQVTGGYRLLVPQGAKIRRVGAQVIVEDDKEYFSRRFYELSQEIEDLKSQIKQLQDLVVELQKKANREDGKAP